MEVRATLTVKADTEAKGQEKINAAAKIINSLPHNDLIYLADLAVKNQNFVQKAKPFVHLL
ncbi:MAG: hypothetical protein ACT4ON_15920 [Bacteroidota bacterium]